MSSADKRPVTETAMGPLVTLALVWGVEILARTGVLVIPNPVALSLIAVVYAGYSGGRVPGLVSAAVALAYGLYVYSAPGEVLRYEGEDRVRIVVFALVAPFVAWMAGTLRERAEWALRQQLEAQRHHVAALESAERRTRKSEAQLRDLVDALPASIAFVDRDLRIQLHNRQMEDMTNLPAPLIDGHKIEDVIGKEVYESLIREHAEQALAGRHVTYERVQMVGGRRRIMEVNMVPSHAEDGTLDGYFAMLFDVTRHMDAQAEIARLGERLRRALANSRLVLWELDLRTGMVQLGREWAEIVGGEASVLEIKSADLRRQVHPDDRPRVDEAVQSVIERRTETYDVEHRVQALDGEWKWVRSTGKAVEFDADGRPLRLSGTNREITSRKRAQLALRDNERRLRLITDTVPAMIGYVDAELRYRYCNRRYCKAMSRPESAILGQTVRAVVGDEQYEIARPLLERALAGEQVEYERRHQWPDGTLADLAVTYVPHLAEDGKVLGLYALLVDLTERKRAERIKELFISMVSHELRTPLTSIIWTLESLVESKASGMSKEESAAVVLAQQNAERMLHLADEILEIEKIDQGELNMNPSVVALSELVGRALALNQGLAHKHAVRIGAAQLAAAKVRADPDRLLQVLANLISNAAKHSPRGGLVEIVIEPRGKMYRTSVKDNGRGVPEQFREMLFGRFAQSSDGRALGGSGLGLAICKEIVERSGGAIGYAPNPQGGSIFWFELPAAPAAGQGG